MPTIRHSKDLKKRLKSTSYASKYLRIAFGSGDEAGFLLALKNVVDAHGGVSAISRKSEITRQHLHRALKESGNPTLSTLRAILSAVGLSLDFTPEKRIAA